MFGFTLPIQFERTVFKSGGSLRVNIPTPMAKALNVSEGDRLIISLNDSQIIMEKARKAR
jgi:antitoxin component of MazEF toxin-antitoxin module